MALILVMALFPAVLSAQLDQVGDDIDGEAANDASGYAVAFSADGNRLAIGAQYNGDTGPHAGHVRVYRWISPNWVQRGQDIDGEAEYTFFGSAVALSLDGSRVAIGAYGIDDPADNSGRVRVFQYYGYPFFDWIQVGANINGEAEDDQFGRSVTLSSDGSRLAIGAPRHDSSSGHVRVYQYFSAAGNWIQMGQDIDGEAAEDWLGSSVSMSSDGSRVAIGAPGYGTQSGRVRVYEWVPLPAIWVQLGQGIDGEAAEDRSGASVALSSDGLRVAVGAEGHDGNGDRSGHVRVFEWVSAFSNWVPLGQDIRGEHAIDHSGRSVALSWDGSMVAIGAPKNGGNGYQSGHVRVYRWNSPSWVQVGPDIDGEAENDGSGASVALSSDGFRVAIGAPYNDGAGNASGHVRVYSVPLFADGFESGDISAWTNSAP